MGRAACASRCWRDTWPKLFSAFALLVMLCCAGGLQQIHQGPPAAQQRPKQEQGLEKRIVAEHAAGNFVPSLEMKECTDFLLTPALLVQEVISDGVLITYPSE